MKPGVRAPGSARNDLKWTSSNPCFLTQFGTIVCIKYLRRVFNENREGMWVCYVVLWPK